MDVPTLLKRNKEYSTTHRRLKTLDEGFDLNAKTFVVSCVDFRSTPEKFMKLDIEDQVIVGRCMGGCVSAQLVTIVSTDEFLKYENLIIVHHTDCGATHLDGDAVRKTLKERSGDDAQVDALQMLMFKDVEQSVRDDIALVKNSKLVRQELKDGTRGFVYDIDTGLLTEVLS